MRLSLNLIFVIFLFLHKTNFAQLLYQLKKDKYVYENLDSVISSKTAYRDIQLNRIKIFCQGGYSPIAYSKADSIFEFNYNVTYILFSCVSPFEDEAMQEYNTEIGKYLDKLYGKSWRSKLRSDALGLKE